MVGKRPNHPEHVMIMLMKKLGFKEGIFLKTYVKWNNRSLKRACPGTGDFFSNCVWGPFKGNRSPYEMDIAFPDDKLDLEVDGYVYHVGYGQERDQKRDEVLKSNGWTVIRIPSTLIYRIFVPCLNKPFPKIMKVKQ